MSISGDRILDLFYPLRQDNSFYNEQKVNAGKHFEDSNLTSSTDIVYCLDKNGVMRAVETTLLH